jgi:hypothetical protein
LAGTADEILVLDIVVDNGKVAECVEHPALTTLCRWDFPALTFCDRGMNRHQKKCSSNWKLATYMSPSNFLGIEISPQIEKHP